MNARHDLQNCLPVPVGGVVRVARHNTHGVGDVRLVMVNSHFKLPTASLYGQSPAGWFSAPGSTVVPHRGLRGCQKTSISSQFSVVRGELRTSKYSFRHESLHVSSVLAVTMSSERTGIFSFTFPIITMRKPHASVLHCSYHTLPRSLPEVRPTAVRSALDHSDRLRRAV